jgi:hypothetical protein
LAGKNTVNNPFLGLGHVVGVSLTKLIGANSMNLSKTRIRTIAFSKDKHLLIRYISMYMRPHHAYRLKLSLPSRLCFQDDHFGTAC